MDFELIERKGGHCIEHTDICPTGALLLMCFALVGAEHQLRRFIALKPKDEQEGRSI